MILVFGPGLVAAGVVVLAAAVLLDNRDLRRARRTGMLAVQRAVRSEDRGTAA